MQQTAYYYYEGAEYREVLPQSQKLAWNVMTRQAQMGLKLGARLQPRK